MDFFFCTIWDRPCDLVQMTLDREDMIRRHKGDYRLEDLIENALMSDLMDSNDEDLE